MTEPTTEGFVYNVTLVPVWEASCVSPMTGKELIVYHTDRDAAKQAIDRQIADEIEAAGLSIASRTDGTG